MAKNKITLFILDDNIPKIPEYVEKSLYDGKLDAVSLAHLVSSAEWTGHHNLKQLTSDILNSEHSKTGAISTFGFTHPEICLTEIEEGLIPDVIVYDWEYGTETNTERSNWLLEILNLTKDFVFVYSKFRDTIPPYLNKKEFQEHSNRLQLFKKGDISSSIFSSEEFILQYILSQISKTNSIKIQGTQIAFKENGYLDSSSDILFLEKIFGKTVLIENLKKNANIISQKSIEEMLGRIEVKILCDTKRNLLVSPDSSLFVEKYSPEKEMTYLEVLKKFGLQKLIEVLEIGLTKV